MEVERLERPVPDVAGSVQVDGRPALSAYVALKPLGPDFDDFFEALLPDIPLNGTKHY